VTHTHTHTHTHTLDRTYLDTQHNNINCRKFRFAVLNLFYLLTVGVEVVLFSLDHTQTHTTVGRTPLDEGSASRRDLYLYNIQHAQETDIHSARGIRTHNPSKQATADLYVRPRSPRDRHQTFRYTNFASCSRPVFSLSLSLSRSSNYSCYTW
jgi:hypothetical protein